MNQLRTVCMVSPLTVSCLLSILGTIHMYKCAKVLNPVVAKGWHGSVLYAFLKHSVIALSDLKANL